MLPSHVKIPDEMRATAERSVDQTKDAFNRYMQATQEIVSTVGDQVALSHVAALDLGKKTMRFAERNVSSSFEFAQKIIQAEDIQEMVRMQTEFVQSQCRWRTWAKPLARQR